jgi:hypothetical protein
MQREEPPTRPILRKHFPQMTITLPNLIQLAPPPPRLPLSRQTLLQ